MAEIITWLNTEPDKSGDRIIPKVRTKGVYDDKNKSLDEKMPFDFGVNEDKYGYYNSEGELIPFEKGGIKKWNELQEKPFEDIGDMLGVDDKQSLYAENYIVAEWDINKKYYLNDFCMYKKKIYRRINENPEGMDFDLAKPAAVFKTAGEFIMYPWTHHKYNNDLAYASWGINNHSYCLYMCSRISPDGARSIASGGWGSEVSPMPGYVDFLGERFWINFQWDGNATQLNLSTRAGLPQITPVNKSNGELDNLKTLKNLLYAAGVWDGTESGILPPDESNRWVLADSKYIFDYIKTIKNDFSWSKIKEKPFASIDKNTLEVKNDELIVKKQSWDDIINKPFDTLGSSLVSESNVLNIKNYFAKPWDVNTKYKLDDYVYYNNKIYKRIDETVEGMNFVNAKTNYIWKTAGESFYTDTGDAYKKYNNNIAYGGAIRLVGDDVDRYFAMLFSTTNYDDCRIENKNYQVYKRTMSFQGYTFYIDIRGYNNNWNLGQATRGIVLTSYNGYTITDQRILEFLKTLLKDSGIWDGTSLVQPPDVSPKWEEVIYITDEIKESMKTTTWSEVTQKPFNSLDSNTLSVDSSGVLSVIGGGSGKDEIFIREEEGQSAGDAVLIIDETEDYYTKFGLTKAKSYSTEEQIVGTWTDGKPIYEKTISTTMPDFTSGGATATKLISISNDFSELIDLRYVTTMTNSFSARDPFFAGDNPNNFTRCYYSYTNNGVQLLNRNVGYNGAIVKLIVQYTKTTDSPTNVPVEATLHNYDDTEKIVGTWFGKPLYEKTIEIKNVKYYGAINISLSDFGISNVKYSFLQSNSYGIRSDSSVFQMSMFNPTAIVSSVGVLCSGNNLYLRFGTTHDVNTYFKEFTLTIQYTKTTD